MTAYTYAHQRQVAMAAPPDAGDIWTWIALAADTKLAINWLVGNPGATRHGVTGVAQRLNNPSGGGAGTKQTLGAIGETGAGGIRRWGRRQRWPNRGIWTGGGANRSAETTSADARPGPATAPEPPRRGPSPAGGAGRAVNGLKVRIHYRQFYLKHT